MFAPFEPFIRRWLNEARVLGKNLGADAVLMQYTGLEDKNGKEIYEGDILYVPGFGNHELKYEDGLYVCEVRGVNQAMAEQCEVIGNIYENPELLTKSVDR